jgi:hypothetical protein
VKWRDSLVGTTVRPQMRQIVRTRYTPRQVPYADTLQYLAISGMLGGIFSAASALRDLGMSASLWTVAAMLVGLGFVYALPKLGRAAYLFVRNGTIEGSVEQVGRAVVDGLGYAGALTSAAEDVHVSAERTVTGIGLIHVEGATRGEERLILDAMGEVLGPIGNPRYLIVRRSPLGKWLRTDYHAVPTAIGQTKDNAEYFAGRWRALVGEGRLAFTRSGPGRRLLLRARATSMASGFQRYADRLSVWQ